MRNFLLWLAMLCKRLLKKPSFLIILLLVPLCVFLLGVASKGDSGFLSIALSATDKNDAVSAEIIDTLLEDNSLINFTFVEDPKVAAELVESGRVDAAWIFPEGMGKKLDSFVSSGYSKNKFVTVIEREQNVFLRISHEKLNFTLQDYTARAYYLDFISKYAPELEGISDQKLLEFYDNISFDEDLFVFDTPTGQRIEVEPNYLLSPIRGVLGVLSVLAGLAAVLYYLSDAAHGTFSRFAIRHRPRIALLCIFIAVFFTCITAEISLIFVGLSALSLFEIITVLLYCLCCTAFSMVLMCILKNIRPIACLIPALVILLFTVCPVFFEFKVFPVIYLKYLFPPTYFINAAFSKMQLIYMLIYTAVCGAIVFLLRKRIADK